jgi:asparagine synthase (glutamine-hydrolysing)
MFAFVIWNQDKQEVFFARDRMGIKPFYYSLDNKRFRFASTLPALLKTDDMSKQLNPNGLHNQFSLHGVVPAPNTIFNSIKKIQPAHCGTLNLNGQLKENRFWSLDSGRQDDQMDSQEWQQAVRDSLMQAVRKRSDVADVPVGVLLSGGLDSSLLVGLLAEAGVKDLKTFTVGFDDQPEEKGSEFEFSDPVAEKFGTDHYKFHVPNDDLIKRLPEAIQAMSEPMFAQDAIALYLLSEQVAK